MEKIIYDYISGIIINKDLSINQQYEKIKDFIIKINKYDKPHKYRFYKTEIDKIEIYDLIYGFIRNDNDSLFKLLEELSKDIAEIITYNENYVIFTKYL